MLLLILAAAAGVTAAEPLPPDQLVAAINWLPQVVSYNGSKDQWKSDPSRKAQCNAELWAQEAAQGIRDTIFEGALLVPAQPHYVLHYLTDDEKHFMEGKARELDGVALSHKYDCGL